MSEQLIQTMIENGLATQGPVNTDTQNAADPTKINEVAPEGQAPNSEADSTTAPKADTQENEQNAAEGLDTPVEILDKNQVLRWVDDDGTQREEPFHRIRSAAMLKDEYDRRINEEVKPLEEVRDKFDAIQEDWRIDPAGFAARAIDTAVKNNYTDWASALHEVYRMARASGAVNVDLIDPETGEQWEPPAPMHPQKTRQEVEYERQIQKTREENFNLSIQSMKFSTLMDKEYAGRISIDHPLVAQAEQNLRKFYQSFAATNPQNPFKAALQFAITEAQAKGHVPLPKPQIANSAALPQNRNGGPQKPALPAKPQQVDLSKYSPNVRAGIEAGIIKVGG